MPGGDNYVLPSRQSELIAGDHEMNTWQSPTLSHRDARAFREHRATPMSNPAPEILETVMTVLRRYPAGASLADLARALDPAPDERTLQRWLAALIKQGRATSSATGDAARYTAVLSAAPAGAAPATAETSASRRSGVPSAAELYAQCAPAVISGALSRVMTVSSLQRQAAFVGMPPVEAAAFVADAMERLDSLTPAAAVALGLTSEQYDAWRRNYITAAIPSSTLPPAQAPTTAPAERALSSAPAEPARKSRRKSPASGDDDIAAVFPTPTANGEVSNRALATAAARMTDWLDRRVPGGVGPVSRKLLPSALTMILVALTARAGAYLWLIALAPLAVFAVWWWVRQPAVTSTPAPAQPGASADANAALLPRAAMSRGRRVLIATAITLAIAGAIAGAIYHRSQQRPSPSHVGDFLAASLKPLPVRVATPDVTYVTSSSAGCRIVYHAMVTTTAPLYRRIDAIEYLRSHAPSDWSAIDAAAVLLRGPNAARLRTALTSPAPTPDLRDIVLYAVQTPPGLTVAAQGTLYAWRSDGAWAFTVEQGGVDRARFPGDAKPLGALAVDQPGDSATLTKLVAERRAYAAKVQAAATALADELTREREQRAKAIGQLLGRGTVFGGTVTTRSETARVALEIMESTAAHRVVALLRNDGGWTDTRRFQGEWALDAEAEAGVVTLRTQNDEAIGRGGPLLETSGTWSVVLQVHTDGTATDSRGEWQLHRLDAAETAALKADFTHAVTQALDATKAGFVYRGTSTSAKDGTIESLYLRFVEQTPDGVTLRATLESATIAGRSRPFRGNVVGNTYRAGRNPIRLRSPDSDRSRVADAKSPLGLNTTNDSLGLALRVDGTRLVGEDDRFVYQFERAPEGAAAPAAQTSDQGLGADVRTKDQGPGTNVMTKDQGPGTRDSAAAVAAARPLFGSADVEQIIVRSLKNFAAQPGAYVFFEGGWVPLPKNNGRAVQGLAQSLNGKLNALTRWEDKLTGKTPAQPVSGTGSTAPVAQIAFDGRTKVPVVGSKNLTLLFVGRVEPLSVDILARYPELKTYPLVELAPLKTLPNGTRVAPLVEVAPGLIAFGAYRVEAMLETPVAGFTLLRCPEPLAPAHYVLTAGNQIFEVEVQ